MKSKIFTGFFLLTILAVYGCSTSSTTNGHVSGDPETELSHEDSESDVMGDHHAEEANLAPDFEINLVDGQTLRLSDLTIDKPTVLYFFATWCPHCRNDLSTVSKVYPEYSDKVNFIAIDLDTKESDAEIKNYRDKLNLGAIKFASGTKDILSDYNVIHTTTKFFIGEGGNIINKAVGEVNEDSWHMVFQTLSQ